MMPHTGPSIFPQGQLWLFPHQLKAMGSLPRWLWADGSGQMTLRWFGAAFRDSADVYFNSQPAEGIRSPYPPSLQREAGNGDGNHHFITEHNGWASHLGHSQNLGIPRTSGAGFQTACRGVASTTSPERPSSAMTPAEFGGSFLFGRVFF